MIAAVLALIALAAVAWTGWTIADLVRAHQYAEHTQDFRTDAQRAADEARYAEVLAEPDETPVIRRLVAADRARIEGATDL